MKEVNCKIKTILLKRNISIIMSSSLIVLLRAMMTGMSNTTMVGIKIMMLIMSYWDNLIKIFKTFSISLIYLTYILLLLNKLLTDWHRKIANLRTSFISPILYPQIWSKRFKIFPNLSPPINFTFKKIHNFTFNKISKKCSLIRHKISYKSFNKFISIKILYLSLSILSNLKPITWEKPRD